MLRFFVRVFLLSVLFTGVSGLPQARADDRIDVDKTEYNQKLGVCMKPYYGNGKGNMEVGGKIGDCMALGGIDFGLDNDGNVVAT